LRFLIALLFVLTYAGMSARRVTLIPIGRPAMAMVGAAACVVAGQLAGEWGLDVDSALRAIEPHTIGLLLGMMVVSAGLAEAGFFAWLAALLARRITTPVALLWSVTIGCGLLSALLVNDAVCLLAPPLVLALARVVRAPSRPFLFAVAMGSNSGSALTLSGNPQNMLVAKLSGLAYRDYLIDAAVPALGALVITAAILHVMFRAELATSVDAPVPPELGKPAGDRALLAVACVAVVGIAIANLLGASMALTALTAASLVILASRKRADHLLTQIDWGVLLFFACLFILVAALQKTGLPTEAIALVGDAHSLPVLAAIFTVGSQIVSNVPLILLLEPWIETLPDVNEAWTTTALVTTLAGNLTLLGSAANIIVFGRAEKPVGFFEYMKVGAPVTVVTTLFALAARWLLS
jgi:Na+/H+ antiporter NhaD/arsenite permease-like protein